FCYSSCLCQFYTFYLDLPFFPTRRSSDLKRTAFCVDTHGRISDFVGRSVCHELHDNFVKGAPRVDWVRFPVHPKDSTTEVVVQLDRKSTRLNSSHGSISYAVFCLKK